MSTATIEPLPSGKAIFELNGVVHEFDSWRAAAAEADARRIKYVLLRFPHLSPAVLTTAPAMRVLT